MFQYLNADSDTTTAVKLSHASSGSKGVTFTPTNIVMDAPLNAMGGMLQIDSTSVGIQSAGQKLVKLTTDSDELLSDSPLALSAIRLTGTGGTGLDTNGKAITVGSVTSGPITVTGNITANGTGIISGVQINGSRGAIGTVNLGWDPGLTTPAASAGNVFGIGFIASGGYFYGDATNAYMRQRVPTSGAVGAAYARVTSTDVLLDGTTVQTLGQFHVMNQRSIQYHRADNGAIWNGGPVIVQTTDPGVANVPEGTIWINA
jgi:hypothetical protein